jgi:hypothetical protein
VKPSGEGDKAISASMTWRLWIEQNPSFDWQTLTTASFETGFRQSQAKFHAVIGTDDPDLSAPSNRRPPTGEKRESAPRGGTLTVIDRGKNLQEPFETLMLCSHTPPRKTTAEEVAEMLHKAKAPTPWQNPDGCDKAKAPTPWQNPDGCRVIADCIQTPLAYQEGPGIIEFQEKPPQEKLRRAQDAIDAAARVRRQRPEYGGLPRPDAARLSVALAQCGEFGFVLFSAAQARGLMSPRLTALASVLITISMLATPFLHRLGAHWAHSARGS